MNNQGGNMNNQGGNMNNQVGNMNNQGGNMNNQVSNSNQLDNTNKNVNNKKDILKNTEVNMFLALLAALSVNEGVKYFINKSIRLNSGTSSKYIYYAVVCVGLLVVYNML